MRRLLTLLHACSSIALGLATPGQIYCRTADSYHVEGMLEPGQAVSTEPETCEDRKILQYVPATDTWRQHNLSRMPWGSDQWHENPAGPVASFELSITPPPAIRGRDHPGCDNQGDTTAQASGAVARSGSLQAQSGYQSQIGGGGPPPTSRGGRCPSPAGVTDSQRSRAANGRLPLAAASSRRSCSAGPSWRGDGAPWRNQRSCSWHCTGYRCPNGTGGGQYTRRPQCYPGRETTTAPHTSGTIGISISYWGLPRISCTGKAHWSFTNGTSQAPTQQWRGGLCHHVQGRIPDLAGDLSDTRQGQQVTRALANPACRGTAAPSHKLARCGAGGVGGRHRWTELAACGASAGQAPRQKEILFRGLFPGGTSVIFLYITCLADGDPSLPRAPPSHTSRQPTAASEF